jgi:hypothetical protein
MNRTANDFSNLNSFFVANVFAEVDISDSDLESRIEEQKQLPISIMWSNSDLESIREWQKQEKTLIYSDLRAVMAI